LPVQNWYTSCASNAESLKPARRPAPTSTIKGTPRTRCRQGRNLAPDRAGLAGLRISVRGCFRFPRRNRQGLSSGKPCFRRESLFSARRLTRSHRARIMTCFRSARPQPVFREYVRSPRLLPDACLRASELAPPTNGCQDPRPDGLDHRKLGFRSSMSSFAIDVFFHDLFLTLFVGR